MCLGYNKVIANLLLFELALCLHNLFLQLKQLHFFHFYFLHLLKAILCGIWSIFPITVSVPFQLRNQATLLLCLFSIILHYISHNAEQHCCNSVWHTAISCWRFLMVWSWIFTRCSCFSVKPSALRKDWHKI